MKRLAILLGLAMFASSSIVIACPGEKHGDAKPQSSQPDKPKT
jgi:hypothetical protein